MFQHQCKAEGIAITRIPDGCRTLGPRKLIRVKSPFDWILSLNGRAALIDTKTTQGDTFPNSKIDACQVGEMLNHAPVLSGYVVRFERLAILAFIPATILSESIERRGSISTLTPGVVHLGPAFDLWRSTTIRKLFEVDAPKIPATS